MTTRKALYTLLRLFFNMIINASIWKRALAYVIDIIIINIFIIWPFKPLTDIKYEGNNFWEIYNNLKNNQDVLVTLFITGITIAILTILYWAILEYYIQQSLGKWILKIRVRSKLKNLSFWQCFVRNITKLSSLLLILDSLYLIFMKTNQRYFEKISNTEVVEEIK